MSDELDYSHKGWEQLPEAVFIGLDAGLRLGRVVKLDLSHNKLKMLPARVSSDGITTDEAVRRLQREQAFIKPTAQVKGDLLYHCPLLQVRAYASPCASLRAVHGV